MISKYLVRLALVGIASGYCFGAHADVVGTKAVVGAMYQSEQQEEQANMQMGNGCCKPKCCPKPKC